MAECADDVGAGGLFPGVLGHKNGAEFEGVVVKRAVRGIGHAVMVRLKSG
jgi:hypothetical protein